MSTKKKLYGVLEPQTSNYGVQAHTLDVEKQEFVNSHFCSSEGFAKSDLGFTTPIFDKVAFSDDPHSTVHFNSSVLKGYQELYPESFELQWIGSIFDAGTDIMNACRIARFKKIPLTDDVLDFFEFSPYWDEAGDFGSRKLREGLEKPYVVYDIDENNDENGDRIEQHFCDESFSELKTVYDLLEDYKSRTGKVLEKHLELWY